MFDTGTSIIVMNSPAAAGINAVSWLNQIAPPAYQFLWATPAGLGSVVTLNLLMIVAALLGLLAMRWLVVHRGPGFAI